ncbi:hypothetical protein M011DRAFT_491212 [Sporormia fimetaria CBS 119925]|uniref:HAUS augmin-like complex subunit 1 n=1 Tax=Sporormia fimetaria CBS 119925 TaxID=1340428 RepID=A0A6A6VQX4_9PLEO|nr:hypothetical protein M011DRAFT_491212 [Sporormia fimetaria CBS 119925]
MDNLTAADLFSPSKARQQRAQAQDWAQIDSWLSYKYAGRTVPTFERNDETLKALRELSLANERADEERSVYEGVEREALKTLDAHPTPTTATTPLSTLQSHLSPSGLSSLSALATTTVTLNLPSAAPETIAHALISHTRTSQSLTNQLTHIQTLQTYLEHQHTLLRTQLFELHTNPAFKTPATLPRQTLDHVRSTKLLCAKIREYEDKLASLEYAAAGRQRAGSGMLAGGAARKGVGDVEQLMEILERQTVLEAMRGKVRELEREVEEYAGLPAEREAARKEVGRLEVECDEVRRRRDGLFGELVRR